MNMLEDQQAVELEGVMDVYEIAQRLVTTNHPIMDTIRQEVAHMPVVKAKDEIDGQGDLPHIVTVIGTTNYAMFDLDLINRPVHPEYVGSLIQAITANNMLRSYPIVVAPSDDGRLKIRDGQHRFVVARILGVPIYYIVDAEIKVEDIPAINNNQHRWKETDYLHFFRMQGKPEYIKFKAFMDEHPWITVKTAQDLTHYGDRSIKGFRTGTFECNDLEFAEEVALQIEQLKPYVSFAYETRFVYAVAMLNEHAGFSFGRLLRKLRFASAKVVKCVDTKQYMAMFTELYNFKSKEEDRIHFEIIGSNSKKRRADRRNRMARRTAG